VAERLVETGGGAQSTRLLLEAAAELAEVTGRSRKGDAGTAALRPDTPPPVDRAMTKRLQRRIAAEQQTVADCMDLAQKARDELTRAIFRQIASDSLRHSEIAASIAQELDRGNRNAPSSGITRADVDRLIAREREAEDHAAMGLSGEVGGVLAVLAASMEADERKHEEILEGLRSTGFPDEKPPGGERKRG
jgi:hypothetical protein